MDDFFNHGIVLTEIPPYFAALMSGNPRSSEPTVTSHTDPTDATTWLPGTDGMPTYRDFTDLLTHSMQVEWINRTMVVIVVILVLLFG